MLGKLCGKAFSRHASVVGGIILIVIGIQMLFEHLSVKAAKAAFIAAADKLQPRRLI